jgi:hypothetical protein
VGFMATISWYDKPLAMKATLIITALFALSGACFASTITVDFWGTITTSSLPGVNFGDPFSGSFTYETTGTTFGNSSTLANYGFFLPQDGVVVNADGFTFAGASYLNMSIADIPFTAIPDPTADQLGVSTDDVFGTLSTNYPGLTLVGTAAQFAVNPALVPSNAIPNPFNLAEVILPGTTADPARAFVHLGNSSTDFTFLGNIDSAIMLPEPTTFAMVLTALSCWALIRRRQDKVRMNFDAQRDHVCPRGGRD